MFFFASRTRYLLGSDPPYPALLLLCSWSVPFKRRFYQTFFPVRCSLVDFAGSFDKAFYAHSTQRTRQKNIRKNKIACHATTKMTTTATVFKWKCGIGGTIFTRNSIHIAQTRDFVEIFQCRDKRWACVCVLCAFKVQHWIARICFYAPCALRCSFYSVSHIIIQCESARSTYARYQLTHKMDQ